MRTIRRTAHLPVSSARTTNGAASGTSETTTNKVMIKTLDFDASTDEFAQFSVRMPKSWNESTITATFVWTHGSTTTNVGVVWGIQGVALSNDDAIDTAFGTAQTVTDTLIATNDMHVSAATSAVTIGGTLAANTPIQFTIYRDVSDAGDDLGVDARLLGVEIIYTAA